MSSGKIIPTVLFIIFMAACAGDDTVTEEQKPISIEFPDVDSTIHIQEDFYHFVNNKWLQTTAVPSGSHKWDHIDMLKSSSRRAVRQLLDFSAGNNPYQERSDMWKAVRFYTLGMDSLKAERDGLLPVGDFLNKIERMENERQMAVFFAEYQQKVSGLFFEVGLKPGDKNHHQDAINIYAGKTGIPRPEYYLEKGDEYDRIRMAYIEYITELLGHLSLDEEVAREQALTILNIETKLVSPASKWKNVPSQDTSYHSMRVADLKKLAENI
ncbi:MAG: M13 family metallopeptidase, partial [Cyclobacteriaceae bacterium]|nr:M13 family metallopeptidase [Cyclobacteriaceae bacterium]